MSPEGFVLNRYGRRIYIVRLDQLTSRCGRAMGRYERVWDTISQKKKIDKFPKLTPDVNWSRGCIEG